MRAFFQISQKIFVQLALGALRLYQVVFPAFRYFFIGTEHSCCFQPSCSHYAHNAYKAHGIIKGTLLILFRILRCNPWNQGGDDPVPKTFLLHKAWKSSTPEHH